MGDRRANPLRSRESMRPVTVARVTIRRSLSSDGEMGPWSRKMPSTRPPAALTFSGRRSRPMRSNTASAVLSVFMTASVARMLASGVWS